MSKKFLTAFSILMLLTMVITAAGPLSVKAHAKSVSDLFTATKFDAHYRVPNEGKIELLLDEAGISLAGMSKAQKQAVVQEYEKRFHEMNPDTPAPEKLNKLLDMERAKSAFKPVVTDRSIKSLVTLVEFNPTAETWTAQVDAAGNCTPTEVTFAGPLHNEIAAPGPRDNNTIWYNDTTPDLYEQLYFGEGPTAGVIVNHPNLGTVDLRGKTMVNYYLEMSGGKFAPAGEVYPAWFQADHSEAWYGEDGCSGSHNVRAGELVIEMLAKLQAQDPNFNWESFDGNADGIVDNFTVVHAGQGQEAGGGEQGNFSIWSHASLVGWPNGITVCTAGSTGCPDRDIRVLHYSMDPENIDLGVISEEFGHAAFGLPDLYATDAQFSISNWAIMESGSWNGILGGAEPAPFPLWFKMLVGWVQPKEIDYNSPATATVIGQLEKTPKLANAGLKINLPDKTISIANPLNTGQAWWSDVADAINHTLTRELDLTGTTAPILTFLSHWSIEEDWDYGYVQVSTDGGATWAFLPDMDGIFRSTSPNGTNQGIGLTGEGEGTLRVDLAAYAGQKIQLRLLYSTDTGTQWNGWFVDNFAVIDGQATVWSDDVEAGADAWTSDGWQMVPLTKIYPRYYLVEWRNNQGFDHGLMYPYATVYNDVDEWQVDRAPYTVPGMLVYLRDTSYAFDYTLLDSLYDAPSYGPKHGLSLVDSHFWPYEWSNYKSASGAPLRVNSRVQPGNASFTLQPTTPFTLSLGYDPATGVYGGIFETKTFGPQPAVSAFHDSLGYFPGLRFKPDTGGLYFWDAQASMAIPAKGNYSTKITWLDKTPVYDLYGYDLGDTILGSGNPGDDGVQYGLHIAVMSKAKDGSSALIQTWNSPALTTLSMAPSKATIKAGMPLTYTLKIKNTTPIPQKFTLNAPIPAGTTFVFGPFYNKTANAIVWKGTIPQRMTLTITYTVKVVPGTPAGTVITNAAVVSDDALGANASSTVTVK